MNDLTAHLTTGAVLMYLLQWAKHSKYVPFLDAEMKKTFRVLSGVGAFGASLGILWNFDAAHGVLTITGLTWPTILAAGKEWVVQWVTQQMLYDTVLGGTSKPAALPAAPGTIPVSLIALPQTPKEGIQQ